MELRGKQWWFAVAGLTAIGLGIRVWAATQESIFLDEVSLRWLASGRSFGSMVDQVRQLENTPILGFGLAWLAAKIGSAPEWVRLPSVIAGTLTIPVTAALARRAVGHWTGIAAAAFVVCSPLLNFFSVEARPYALACFFATTAALVLLRACDEDSPRWGWPAWTLLAALAMLSHYTVVFALAAQVIWAIAFRSKARMPLLGALPAAGFLFAVAWLGPFRDQLAHSDQQVQFMKFLAPVTPGQFIKLSATAVAGRPIVPLSDLPGPLLGGLIAVIVAIAVSVFALAIARLGKGSRWITLDGAIRSDAGLVLAVAAIPPACLVLASVASGGSFMLTRNAIAAVPCALILVAAGLSQLGKGFKDAAAAGLALLLLAVTIIGTVNWQRPLMRDAAAAIAAHWQPGDIVLEQTYSQAALNDADLAPYLPQAIVDSLTIARVPRHAEAAQLIESTFTKAVDEKRNVFVIAPITASTPTAAGPPPALARTFSRNLLLNFGGAGPLQVVEWSPPVDQFD